MASTYRVVLLFVICFTAVSVSAQKEISFKGDIVIGGIRQAISITGHDSSLPLLLFLHGGPGGSVMHYADKFTNKLQQHFIVVQWDQRQTGETLKLNSSPLPLTLDLFQNDTHELIDSLLKRFNREKLFLVGHSWGTALGFHFAKQYPEKLYAYIAIGAMTDQVRSEQLGLQKLKEIAIQKHNDDDLARLDSVHIPFQNGTQLYHHRKSLLAFQGSKKPLEKNYVLTWADTWLAVYNEAMKVNLFETATTLECPVYFFAGRKDLQTNSEIAFEYYEKLKAPRKGFFWLERSAHAIPTSEPELLQNIIINKILPEVTGQ
jgi:pimeloyl-ACP methyl ester carboxylesterase